MWYGLTAALASLGFAVLFNVRGKNLWVAAEIGGFAGLIYEACIEAGASVAVALFVASFSLALASEIAARHMKTPVTTFLICALIPLVPGGSLYYTVLEVVQGNLDGAIIKGIDTIVQACSITIGVTLVSSAMRMLVRYKNRRRIQ